MGSESCATNAVRPHARLRPAELVFTARVVAVAVVAPLLVRLPLPRLQRVVEPRWRRPPQVRGEVGWITDAVGRRVDRVLLRGRPLLRPGGRVRGLTLYWFLRRAGLDVTLCCGAAAPGGSFAGRCWIEHRGVPILERTDPRKDLDAVVHLSRAGVRDVTTARSPISVRQAPGAETGVPGPLE